LVRRAGGWENVAALRRGRKAYRADARILGSSTFVDIVIGELEKAGNTKNARCRLDLETLEERIATAYQLSPQVLSSGSRMAQVSHVRSVLCYLWVRYVGQSGHKLADRLRISPQAVYSAAARTAKAGSIGEKELEQGCRN
jgi:hypothetical protein